jgi:hypothetical protein
MVVNNKVDTLTYDVEAGQPRVSGAAAPPPHQRSTFVVEQHKVSAPERRSTARALGQRLAEIFFPDDPLHQFKNQSFARKLVLALQYFFPIFDWGSHYSLKLLRSDAIAGLTIASLAIPQVIPSISPLIDSPPPPSRRAAFNSHPFLAPSFSGHLLPVRYLGINSFPSIHGDTYVRACRESATPSSPTCLQSSAYVSLPRLNRFMAIYSINA